MCKHCDGLKSMLKNEVSGLINYYFGTYKLGLKNVPEDIFAYNRRIHELAKDIAKCECVEGYEIISSKSFKL